MDSITVKSPAKLNLHLRILGRRKDGYHNLVTVFHRISLADQIKIKKRNVGFSLASNMKTIPVDETNLIARAYRLLQSKFKRLGGVDVYLRKNISAGAGLGGGSSNAASFLVAIKKLYGLRISKKELQKMSLGLGADVPFFLEDKNQAIAWSVGERLEVAECRKKYYFVVVLPEKSLSTAKVYANCRVKKGASLTKEKRVARILCRSLSEGKLSEAAAVQRNDLERAAFDLQPSIERVMNHFSKSGASNVRMTGSGPTVYSACQSLAAAKTLQKNLSRLLKSKRVVICRSC